MSNTLYRVTCGQFTGGFIVDENHQITKTAPFLTRINGFDFHDALNELMQWDGVIIERVSPGRQPNIPKGMPTHKEAFASLESKEDEEPDREPCPECNNGILIPQIGGGVQCDNCPYWFCY